MHHTAYIRKILRFIERNLSDDLDTELLTSIGCVSRDKLYADFYSLSGHTIKEYIRKRRLSNALALIKTSDIGLSEIAYQCGYSSHQALCRAVKGALDITPTEYRAGHMYYFFPSFKGYPLQSVCVVNEMIPSTLRVLFYHISALDIENMAMNIFLNAYPDYRGRIFGRNGERKDGKYCYELYVTEADRDYSVIKPYGFFVDKIAPGFTAQFAASTVQNESLKVTVAWDYLYTEWLRVSMFEQGDAPYFEEYLLRNGRAVKLKLRLPIRDRLEETRITVADNPQLHFIGVRENGPGAEERASRRVIDYMKLSFPHLLKTSKDIYLSRGQANCVCGVRVQTDLRVMNNPNLLDIVTDRDRYLVLKSRVTGDYDRYAELLLTFARENGMTVDEAGIFALYTCDDEKSDELHIRMYCPLKLRTK